MVVFFVMYQGHELQKKQSRYGSRHVVVMEQGSTDTPFPVFSAMRSPNLEKK